MAVLGSDRKLNKQRTHSPNDQCGQFVRVFSRTQYRGSLSVLRSLYPFGASHAEHKKPDYYYYYYILAYTTDVRHSKVCRTFCRGFCACKRIRTIALMLSVHLISSSCRRRNNRAAVRPKPYSRQLKWFATRTHVRPQRLCQHCHRNTGKRKMVWRRTTPMKSLRCKSHVCSSFDPFGSCLWFTERNILLFFSFLNILCTWSKQCVESTIKTHTSTILFATMVGIKTKTRFVRIIMTYI